MIIKEVQWIRQNKKKFSPGMVRIAMQWYRPVKFMPCFMQSTVRKALQPVRRVPVIVQVADEDDGVTANTVASGCKCKISKNLPLLHSFSAKVTEKKLKSLAENGKVTRIWHDTQVKAVLDIAAHAVGSNLLWDTGITGKGVVVAVLDTGIFEHPDLKGRIIAFKDFVNDKTSPYDDNGHGTHVAGDIAADGSQSGRHYRGPAPEAKLVGVKVLDKMGGGPLSGVIEGLQWCIENKDRLKIRVINVSLGVEATASYADDPACLAVEEAWKAGIVVCVAAGNEGPQRHTIGSPGIDPLVITVGASDDADTVAAADDKIADYSSRGPTIDGLTKPDILSPGSNVISLRSPGSWLDKQNEGTKVENDYVSLSGTSMASPVCCGVVAQMLQVDSSLTPDEVKKLLASTAVSLNMDPNIQGAGVINAQKAVGQIKKRVTLPRANRMMM